MNRREALKRMGAIVAGAAVASTGLLSLVSCERERKRIVFYFTGTGNSLYAARQLSDENTELLSIPQMMKEGRYDFEADEIGIVYPIYGFMPPNMVRRFIEKSELKAAYKFAVLTYGNGNGNSVEIWDDISRRAGNPFDYIATLLMVDNWLPNFDMNEQIKIDKHIPENLQRINEDISSGKHWHESITADGRERHRTFLQRSGIDPEVGFLKRSETSFSVTDACIGCGICTEVCPRGNYNLTAGGVNVHGECEFCFACIQNCPQKAIRFADGSNDPLLANGEKNPNARFRNEHISIMDLKRANRQF